MTEMKPSPTHGIYCGGEVCRTGSWRATGSNKNQIGCQLLKTVCLPIPFELPDRRERRERRERRDRRQETGDDNRLTI